MVSGYHGRVPVGDNKYPRGSRVRARLRNLGYNASLRGQGRGGCVHPVRQVYAGLDEAQMQRAARAEELLFLDAHRRAAARQGSSTVGLPSKAV